MSPYDKDLPEHPSDATTCRWCWGWGPCLAVIWRGDDGEEEIGEVDCARCGGCGVEPKAVAA